METYKAIALAVKPIGVKAYAGAVGCSAGYVYKMMRPCPTPANPSTTGEANFMDKVHAILAEWIKGGIDPKPLLEQICGKYGYGVYEQNLISSGPDETLSQLTQFNICVGECTARILKAINNGTTTEKESEEIERYLVYAESAINTLRYSNKRYREPIRKGRRIGSYRFQGQMHLPAALNQGSKSS